MELLTHDFLDEFYSPEDANRAVREHLEGIVSILAWIATIDAFQHRIYTNPGHTKEERHQQWIELGERFGSILDWSEFEEWRKVGWQRQLHLLFSPTLSITSNTELLNWVHCNFGFNTKKNSQTALDNYARSM